MIKIRKPKEAELAALSKMARQVITKDLKEFPDKARFYYFSGIAKDALEFRLNHTKGLVLSAWENKTPAGFLTGTAPEGGVATIIWILVSGAKQGEGLGRKMFEEACRFYEAQGCHKVRLTAHTEKLKKYYKKLGMKEEGFHPQHWWKMDFWSFGKEL
jgi:ribosomal protein S18 acetylase RimI-like enzyme